MEKEGACVREEGLTPREEPIGSIDGGSESVGRCARQGQMWIRSGGAWARALVKEGRGGGGGRGEQGVRERIDLGWGGGEWVESERERSGRRGGKSKWRRKGKRKGCVWQAAVEEEKERRGREGKGKQEKKESERKKRKGKEKEREKAWPQHFEIKSASRHVRFFFFFFWVFYFIFFSSSPSSVLTATVAETPFCRPNVGNIGNGYMRLG